MELTITTPLASGSNTIPVVLPKKGIVRQALITASADPGTNSVGATVGTDTIIDASDSANKISNTPAEVTNLTFAEGADEVVSTTDIPIVFSIDVANACNASISLLVDEFVIK